MALERTLGTEQAIMDTSEATGSTQDENVRALGSARVEWIGRSGK